MAKNGQPVQPYRLGMITRELEAMCDWESRAGLCIISRFRSRPKDCGRSYLEEALCQGRARGRCLLDPCGVGDSDWGWHALRELAHEIIEGPLFSGRPQQFRQPSNVHGRASSKGQHLGDVCVVIVVASIEVGE